MLSDWIGEEEMKGLSLICHFKGSVMRPLCLLRESKSITAYFDRISWIRKEE